MAWLRPTPHYKGHFPLDAGGVIFGGYGQKEVTPDTFAAQVAGQNFPYVVPCDRSGKYLVDVPAVEIKTEVLVPATVAKVAGVTNEVAEEKVAEAQPVVEVETSKKKGK
jgi:hypothetical protein